MSWRSSVPGPDFRLKTGDVLTIVGRCDDIERLEKLAQKEA